ncbi:DUF7344 domain-containing protein [Halopiger xanaduensis]|uniref:DUF7344 domain-containing protein n=1 Tax=Halopiger xanaduensis (strain DSM 18323 / JCM 14033 / SH-6) TaxID=797210 RepID=F8D3R9_HALXS|nr:hypothetical protein [Halopiger xanaduensis]AEH38572.1 hypothetical protein Halxa_3967 [Halopiger xanaduensis SH-6]
MSSPPVDEPTPAVAFDALATVRRRCLLAVLLERRDRSAAAGSSAATETETDTGSAPSSLSLATLATEIASLEAGQPIVSDDHCTHVHVSLVHVHLPKLADAGLVERDVATDGAGNGDETTVSLASHPLLEGDWIRTLLESPVDGGTGDDDLLDRTCEALRSARCRTVCRVLARHRGAVPVDDLAALVAAREGDGDDDRRLVDVTESEVRDVGTDLAHNRLPALADAGLVTYDRDEAVAALATDAPQWRTDWLAASPLAPVADRLETASASPSSEHAGSRRPEDASSVPDGVRGEFDVGTGRESDGDDERDGSSADRTPSCWAIDGAENIVARGHDIAAGAEDELFVTVPDDGILQRQCLERWRAAAERGVDVYVGSRSSQVRDTVRAAVPDATVCEPRLDWLNFPVDRVHHGRVVFADRERVMLVTIEDGGADGSETDDTPRVTAVTGEGPENALAALVREHLGPRLDRLESTREGRESEETDGTPSPLPM